MSRRLLVLSLCLLLGGCLSGPSAPPTRYYLLRSADSSPASGRDLTLVQVTLAAYLQQPGLVMATDGNELLVARHHQWAEPLLQSVPALLSRLLAARYGTPTPPSRWQLYVTIEQLHPTTAGQAVLEASWRLQERDSEQIRQHHWQQTLPLTDDGFDAAIDTQKALLQLLSDAILASVPADSPTAVP